MFQPFFHLVTSVISVSSVKIGVLFVLTEMTGLNGRGFVNGRPIEGPACLGFPD